MVSDWTLERRKAGESPKRKPKRGGLDVRAEGKTRGSPKRKPRSGGLDVKAEK